MPDRIRLSFATKTLSENISLWFTICNIPLFRNAMVRVVTQDPATDGEFYLPVCMGAERFGALIQNSHPENLICDACGLRMRFSVTGGVLEIETNNGAGESAAARVKKILMELKGTPELSIPAEGKVYYGIRRKAKKKYWLETVSDIYKKNFPEKKISWTDERGLLQGDDPSSESKIGVLFAGSGDNYLIYDGWNDRLSAGKNVPNLSGAFL